MVAESVLAQLKDIYLPKAVDIWPLAWGWWMLLLLMLLVSAVACYLAVRYKKQGQAKKRALSLLDEYERHYQCANNSQETSACISELLKRVALVYYPRHDVAAMQGMPWIDFLTRTSNDIDFQAISWMLIQCPFKANESESITPLIIAARGWIQQRKKPCSN